MNDYISKPFDPAELKRKLLDLTSGTNKTFSGPANVKTRFEKKDHENISVKPVVQSDSGTASEPEFLPKIDLTYLKQIGGDNPDFLMQMIEMFIQKTPLALEEMNEKFKQQSWEDLRNIAHRIKPSYTYIGLKEIHNMLAEIEQCSVTQSNLDSISLLMSNVETQTQAAFRALEAELVKLR